MEKQENKIKHLEMIEKIIERMARNSFQLKAWAMTLVTVVGALSAKEADKRFMLLAFVPIIGFWLLDAFYVQQERRYKALYRNVCEKTEEEIDELTSYDHYFSAREAVEVGLADEIKRFDEMMENSA